MRFLHIYSAMPVLVLMLFFAITGFYLNHPELEPGKVSRARQELVLPDWVSGDERWADDSAKALKLLHWLDLHHGIRGVDFAVEYDEMDGLLIIDMSGPNGNSVIEVSAEDGLAFVDTRTLPLLAMLNNVHRAKHVNGLWRYLSDFSALCMLVFCFSGCWLLALNKLERGVASITMLVGSGLFLFVIWLMH